jgi:hypothetical protein
MLLSFTTRQRSRGLVLACRIIGILQIQQKSKGKAAK